MARSVIVFVTEEKGRLGLTAARTDPRIASEKSQVDWHREMLVRDYFDIRNSLLNTWRVGFVLVESGQEIRIVHDVSTAQQWMET